MGDQTPTLYEKLPYFGTTLTEERLLRTLDNDPEPITTFLCRHGYSYDHVADGGVCCRRVRPVSDVPVANEKERKEECISTKNMPD